MKTFLNTVIFLYLFSFSLNNENNGYSKKNLRLIIWNQKISIFNKIQNINITCLSLHV